MILLFHKKIRATQTSTASVSGMFLTWVEEDRELEETVESQNHQSVRDCSLSHLPRFKPSDYALVRMLLEKLSLEQRLMIEMRFWQGLSVTEIAESLGVSWGEVQLQIAQTLVELKVLCESNPQFSRFRDEKFLTMSSSMTTFR